MSEKELIADRTIYAVAKDGRGFEIQLMIGRPYRVESGEWACPVALSGLHDRQADMRGVDSWQVLILALQLIKQLLSLFVEDGGKLFWEKGGGRKSL